MTETFGNFFEADGKQEHLLVRLSFTSLSIERNWHNNSLLADFLANCQRNFFRDDDIPSQNRQDEVSDAVSFIANELLENAMKSGYEAGDCTISIMLHIFPDLLRFYVTNSIKPQKTRPFQNFIRELLTEDPERLYVRQLTSVADDVEPDEVVSCLGFLTLLCDYNARLAWKFRTVPENPKAVTVTTMAQIAIQ